MESGNVMTIPLMKRMAAKCHDRIEVEKKKAMDKQEKERQKLYSMKGKG